MSTKSSQSPAPSLPDFEHYLQAYLKQSMAMDDTPSSSEIENIKALLNRGESSMEQWQKLVPENRYGFGLGPSFGIGLSMAMMMARDFFTARYSLVAPVTEVLDALAAIIGQRPVVELGCGTGYIASRLIHRGVSVRCTDISPVTETNRPYNFQTTYVAVEELDATAAVQSAPENAVLLLTWPSYESNFAAAALPAMRPGQTLVYNGEFSGGCCADDSFFEALAELSRDDSSSRDLNASHVQWPGIHDRWGVYMK